MLLEQKDMKVEGLIISLRGRSGRQGDPGNSIFYISLEDDLMRIFGSESIDGIMKKFGLERGRIN